MTTSTGTRYPKLRAVDPRPIVHQGRPFVLLRDPLQMSDKILLVPQPLVPVLALCDGTREDAKDLSLALAIRFGMRIEPEIIEQLLATLDEALLLNNDHYALAGERALVDYREGPCRQPALAGGVYPADRDELKLMLDGYLDGAEAGGDLPPVSTDGRGLVSPHIDYARGGPVYARVWKRAADMVREAELVVVFGTDHFGGDSDLTLTRQNYATPFGVLPTAAGVVDALAEAIGEEAAFAGELRHRGEHSIELAAVWLHHMRGGEPVEMVPVLCGSFGSFVRGEAEAESDRKINRFLETLEEATAGRRTMIVAAGDLAHIGPAFGGEPVGVAERERLKEADDELIARMCAGDADGFLETICREGDRNNVCGISAIYLALRMLGASKISFLRGEEVAYDRCPADEFGTSLVSVCGVVFQ
ncbi:MAG: AmmeMemoRadiSam system protein B [Blastocatellia bacterium]|nr:AmmeMemoRadiSam system protein B [Blastocatellia bacterium]